jgi:hypothetical protein
MTVDDILVRRRRQLAGGRLASGRRGGLRGGRKGREEDDDQRDGHRDEHQPQQQAGPTTASEDTAVGFSGQKYRMLLPSSLTLLAAATVLQKRPGR